MCSLIASVCIILNKEPSEARKKERREGRDDEVSSAASIFSLSLPPLLLTASVQEGEWEGGREDELI